MQLAKIQEALSPLRTKRVFVFRAEFDKQNRRRR